MAKKTIFIVGNPMLEQDSMPLKIMPLLAKMLPQFEFEPFEPTKMDIPQNVDLVFIDTVAGLKEVRALEDIDRIVEVKACSLHDFDLGTQLKLLKKFGMLGKVKIICVPAKGETEKIAEAVAKLLI
jgi:hypothetical protein